MLGNPGPSGLAHSVLVARRDGPGNAPASGEEILKLFECENCGQALFFENSVCTGCQRSLGYAVEAQRLVCLPEGVVESSEPFVTSIGKSNRYVRCRNYSEHEACNWLVLADTEQPYCRSCELTEIIPDLSDSSNKQAWTDVERAKRRLLYTLYALDLPVVSKRQDSARGLAFQFLKRTQDQPVVTGHDEGLITLDVDEANAAFRENMREKLGEGYRTVLGHLRHEIGHYYWDQLVRDSPLLTEFRQLFGDEQLDYKACLERHYEQGPPPDWSKTFISAYATMHPWEDWAETWAHYLHMVDTLETAKSHGLAVSVPGKSAARISTDALTLRDFQSLAAGWQAVTLALNSLSRSMGVKDVYPFVLSPAVLDKLSFIQRLIVERAQSVSRPAPRSARAARS